MTRSEHVRERFGQGRWRRASKRHECSGYGWDGIECVSHGAIEVAARYFDTEEPRGVGYGSPTWKLCEACANTAAPLACRQGAC